MSFLQGLSSDFNKKGEDKATENEHGEGGGRKRGPVYCHICRYLEPSQLLTSVSYVEQ